MNSDVIVIGAGPIGLAAGRAAADAGAAVEVLEKRDPEGAPSCCTGLVGPGTLSILGASQAPVLRHIRAVRLHCPSGKTVDVRSQNIKAVVLDRVALENDLRDRARDAGVALRFCTEVIGAETGRVRIRSRGTEQTLCASVLVGADGPNGPIASWFSIAPPEVLISAAQVELQMEAPCEDRVEIFVGETVAPGFFGWCVPAECGVVRVGLGVAAPQTPTRYLDALLDTHFPQAHILRRSAGRIPLARTAQSAADGLLLVGDAAGHVKPLSGGGLYPGGRCANIAGRLAAQAARDLELRGRLPEVYLMQWTEAVGRELTFGDSVRHHLARLRDRDVEMLAEELDDPLLLQFIAERADIDRLHQLPDQLASDPRLWASMLRLVPLISLGWS